MTDKELVRNVLYASDKIEVTDEITILVCLKEKDIPEVLLNIIAGYLMDLAEVNLSFTAKTIRNKENYLMELGAYYEARTLFHSMPPVVDIKFGLSLLYPYRRVKMHYTNCEDPFQNNPDGDEYFDTRSESLSYTFGDFNVIR